MQDKMYLDHALEQYLGMKNCFTSKSAERRSFDAAVAAWDALQAQLQSSSQNQSQPTTTNNSSISHPRPHRRPQNRQVSAASTATTATYSNNNSSTSVKELYTCHFAWQCRHSFLVDQNWYCQTTIVLSL